MDFNGIIKRAWRVTWRFKALWVLGLFAGISGCQGGGGSGGNYSGGGSDFSGTSGSTPSGDFSSAADYNKFMDSLRDLIPVVIGISVLLVVLWVVWTIVSVAARAGLVFGVSEYEQGRRPRLREMWSTGFSHFWNVVWLDILLALPVFVLAIAVIAGVTIPIITTAMAGGAPDAGMFGPMCGVLAVGLPLLAVASLVLGIMHLIAMRYVVLGGQGAFEASKNAWRFFRNRLKDTAILWLINAGLNFAASFVLGIPVLIVSVPLGIALVGAIVSESIGAIIGFVALLVLVVSLLSSLYSAFWGTFTSALWTIFFRDVLGLPSTTVEQLPVMGGQPYGGAPYPTAAGAAPYAPAQAPAGEPTAQPPVAPGAAWPDPVAQWTPPTGDGAPAADGDPQAGPAGT